MERPGRRMPCRGHFRGARVWRCSRGGDCPGRAGADQHYRATARRRADPAGRTGLAGDLLSSRNRARPQCAGGDGPLDPGRRVARIAGRHRHRVHAGRAQRLVEPAVFGRRPTGAGDRAWRGGGHGGQLCRAGKRQRQAGGAADRNAAFRVHRDARADQDAGAAESGSGVVVHPGHTDGGVGFKRRAHGRRRDPRLQRRQRLLQGRVEAVVGGHVWLVERQPGRSGQHRSAEGAGVGAVRPGPPGRRDQHGVQAARAGSGQ
ncbi:hypothetical protein D3C71_1425340 [compost metagenome]